MSPLTSSQDVLYSFPASVSSMAIHPTLPYYMAFGLGDGSVQVLDRRMIFKQQQDSSLCSPTHPFRAVRNKYTIGSQVRKITSVQFNHNGSELLASYSEDFVYLFSSRQLGCGTGGGEIVKPAHLSRCGGHSSAVPRKQRSKVGGVKSQSADDAGSSQGVKNNTKSPTEEPPVKKKLRLRGDWSDTGPEACPEVEGSESQGRSLMNHMSNMFAQWIDMSLSPDEQEREGGGVLGRARRRINMRRRQREERGRGREERGREREERGRRKAERRSEGEGHLERSGEGLTSSSSSDNSFNLFDERDRETEELDGSYGTGDVEGVEGGAVGGASSPREEEDVEKGGMAESVGGRDEECLGTFDLTTKSSGECTVNELTREYAVTPSSAHHSEEGKEDDVKCSSVVDGRLTPNSAHHTNEGLEPLECSAGGEDSGTRVTLDVASGYEATPDSAHLDTTDGNMLKCRTEGSATTSTQVALDSTQHSPSKESPDHDSQLESAVLVESRTLNFCAVPTINVIEDETDSDDNFENVVSRDDVEDSAVPSRDLKLGEGREAEGSEGHFGGRDCLSPFMVYKGHRNARTMVYMLCLSH